MFGIVTGAFCLIQYGSNRRLESWIDPTFISKFLFFGGEGVGGALNALPPYASVAR